MISPGLILSLPAKVDCSRWAADSVRASFYRGMCGRWRNGGGELGGNSCLSHSKQGGLQIKAK